MPTSIIHHRIFLPKIFWFTASRYWSETELTPRQTRFLIFNATFPVASKIKWLICTTILIFVGYGSWNFSFGTALDCCAANVQSMPFTLCTPGQGNCSLTLRFRHASAVLVQAPSNDLICVIAPETKSQISQEVRLRNVEMKSDN